MRNWCFSSMLFEVFSFKLRKHHQHQRWCTGLIWEGWWQWVELSERRASFWLLVGSLENIQPQACPGFSEVTAWAALVVFIPFTCQLPGVCFSWGQVSDTAGEHLGSEKPEGPPLAPLPARLPQGLWLLPGEAVLSVPFPAGTTPWRGHVRASGAVWACASLHLAFTCVFRYLSHFGDPLCLGVGMEGAVQQWSSLKLIL